MKVHTLLKKELFPGHLSTSCGIKMHIDERILPFIHVHSIYLTVSAGAFWVNRFRSYPGDTGSHCPHFP